MNALAQKTAETFSPRPLQESDMPAVVALHRACLGTEPSERALRWRYFALPQGAAPVMVAFNEGQCIALCAAWPVMLSVNAEETTGVCYIDAMTHPDYRKQDIQARLAEQCQERLAAAGYRAAYAFPSDPAYPVFKRDLHCQDWGTVAQWVRPLWYFGPSKLSGMLAKITFIGLAQTDDYQLEETMPKLDAAAALQMRRTFGACRVLHDAPWLEWRYHADSSRDYRWSSAYADKKIKAYAVWRYDAASGHAYLCELAGEASAMRAVLIHVVQAAFAQKSRSLSMLTSDPDNVPVLKSCGFLPRASRKLVGRVIGDGLPAALDAKDVWRLSGGDCEQW